MSIKQFTKHLTIETFVHALLVCFALASVGTIGEFFTSNGHNALTSYGLAAALGFGLVAVSIMLGRTDMSDKTAFMGMLAGVVVVAAMSATVQTMSYHNHVGGWEVASVLGIGFPLVECVLALGISLHDLAQRRQRAFAVRDSIQQRIGDAVADSMAEIDVSRVRSHIADRIDGIVLAQVDDVIASMGLSVDTEGHSSDVSGNVANESLNAIERHDEPEIATHDTVDSHHSATFGPQNLQAANDAKLQQVEDRRNSILQLYKMSGEMGLSELQNVLQDDFGIVSSDSTIRSDLAALVDDGDLIKSGRGRWSLPMAIDETLPVIGEPVLNGVEHHEP